MDVVFYTREGCSLCVQGHAILARVMGERPFRVIDVDEDDAIRSAYGEFVPVVEVDGARVSQWRIDEQRLREALAGGDSQGKTERAPRRLLWRRKAR